MSESTTPATAVPAAPSVPASVTAPTPSPAKKGARLSVLYVFVLATASYLVTEANALSLAYTHTALPGGAQGTGTVVLAGVLTYLLHYLGVDVQGGPDTQATVTQVEQQILHFEVAHAPQTKVEGQS